jgi:hypothetical protein
MTEERNDVSAMNNGCNMLLSMSPVLAFDNNRYNAMLKHVSALSHLAAITRCGSVTKQAT